MTPLPGFTNSAGFVVQAPCVTFIVPNRSPAHYPDRPPAHYPDVNIVGKAMLPNVLASSSKEDLKILMKDALLGKLKLPNSQLFKIWCKLYDKSYTSPQEKRYRFRVFVKNKSYPYDEMLYRLTVFADNIKIILDLSKRKKVTMDLRKRRKNTYNMGTYTYEDLLYLADRTQAEIKKVYCGGESKEWKELMSCWGSG